MSDWTGTGSAAATEEPLSLADVKLHLRVDDDTEDELINSLITTAREYCEGFQRRAYLTQTQELWLDSFPSAGYIKLSLPPLQSVTHIKYYGTDDTEYTFTPDDYFVDIKNEPGRVSLGYGKTWPSTTLRPANGVNIEYVAGYGDAASDVPEKVRQAMLLLISHWYENREAVALTGAIPKEIPLSVEALLWQDRCF